MVREGLGGHQTAGTPRASLQRASCGSVCGRDGRSLADRLGQEACVLSGLSLGPGPGGMGGVGGPPCPPWEASNAEPAPATSLPAQRPQCPTQTQTPVHSQGGQSQEVSGSAASLVEREGGGAGWGCRPRAHLSMRLCPPSAEADWTPASTSAPVTVSSRAGTVKGRDPSWTRAGAPRLPLGVLTTFKLHGEA